MLAVELLHGQYPYSSQCPERVALQAMVLRVVVDLAEDDVARARRALEHLVREDEDGGACVPDPAGERMVLESELVRAGGEGRAGEGC
jgi:hypothetical protein